MFDSPHAEPFVAVAADGYVLLDGPMIAVTLKPSDGLFIAEQLIMAAAQAAAHQPER